LKILHFKQLSFFQNCRRAIVIEWSSSLTADQKSNTTDMGLHHETQFHCKGFWTSFAPKNCHFHGLVSL
jgi:hypothetical protein